MIPSPLRSDLEVSEVEHKGQPMILLQGPSAEDGRPVMLSQGAVMAAALFDGKTELAQLQAAILRETGTSPSLGQLQDLARHLEKAGLLDTPEVRERRKREWQAYRDSPVREAAHVGGVYPAQVLELAGLLGGFYRHPKGPGAAPPHPPRPEPPPLGLIAPHIDFTRGGPAYGWAYGDLASTQPPDLIVALGVAHVSPDSPWVPTKKAYKTPYGAMETDLALYEEFAGHLWYDPLADEAVHRREHSLEFQAVWLKHLWKDQTPKWLPLLVSTFERFAVDRPPSAAPAVEKALAGFGRALAARAKKGERILVLAGVDLAHVGPHFGDDLVLGPELAKKVEAEDRASMEHALRLDADRFYLSVTAEGHWRKVCGLSALYTALRWIAPLADGAPLDAKLLAYDQAPDPRGGLVSFASAVYRRSKIL